ncbi:MAG: YidC/Oxa1 family membrane protein insertase [Candidatus Berkelbacteria bacterium]|nr:YidC/Oxa1 family membrane protein insertase [Candidatus Berkelbacteria bacterium]
MSFWNTILYQPLFNLLIIFYNYLGHNLGIAIIALTILIRLILLPMTNKSLVAQKKMKELQPHLERIKNDHGHDKKKMTQATLELYKEHGVNPLTTSCLPLLIQFPIFIALYRVFFNFSKYADFSLLYPFVHRPESVNTHFLWLNLSSFDPLYILPILAGLTLFWQTKMMMPNQGKQLAKNEESSKDNKGQQMEDFQKMFSKQMIYIFPAMTFMISLKLPSALVLYWVVTTLVGIVQQYMILKNDGIQSTAKGTLITVKKRE